MKTILIPTDFSDAANNAAYYAAALSNRLKIARVILLNSYAWLRPEYINLTDVLQPLPAESNEQYENSNSQLNLLKAQLEKKMHPQVEIVCCAEAEALDYAIPEAMSRDHPDLIVTGIESFGDSKGFMSIGKQVIKIALDNSSPVLIVPANVSFQSIQSILLTCELKDVGIRIPRTLVNSLIRDLAARLIVVNIDSASRHLEPEFISEQRVLHDMFDVLQPEYYSLEDKDVVEAIARFANQKGVQLIVSVPRKRNLFERLFQPELTKKLAGITPIPLLIARG